MVHVNTLYTPIHVTSQKIDICLFSLKIRDCFVLGLLCIRFKYLKRTSLFFHICSRGTNVRVAHSVRIIRYQHQQQHYHIGRH